MSVSLFDTKPVKIGILEDEQVPSSVQVSKEWSYDDPRYGTVNITEADFDEMIASFDKKHLGREVFFNYDHNEMLRGENAGLITRIYKIKDEANPETPAELWADVEWTPKAREAIRDKEYCYTSAEWFNNYERPDMAGMNFGKVFAGAALTNDPAIFDLKPLVFNNKRSFVKGESKMDLEKTIADLQEQMKQVMAMLNTLSQKPEEGEQMSKEEMSEAQEMMQEKYSAMEKKLNKISQDFSKKERTLEVDRLILDNKLLPAQKDEALSMTKEEFSGYVKALESMPEAVKTEKISNGDAPEVEDDATSFTKIVERAKEIMSKDNTINEAVAMNMAVKENKEFHNKIKGA